MAGANKTQTQMQIQKYLSAQGIDMASFQNHMAYVRVWEEWYAGNVADFHKYNYFNGITTVKCNRYSLGMAKKIAQDHASLLLNEKVGITVDNEAFQKTLDDILKANRFRVRANQLLELSFALGAGAFVEFLDAKGNVNIDYINAKSIYPITVVNGEVTECAFVSETASGESGKTYYVNIHRLNDAGNYDVENHTVRINGDNAAKEMESEGIEPIVNTNSPVPRFQIIKPNIVNNIDINSAMGISVFANSIDELKAIDVVFDSYVNEFILGRKRVYVPASMAKMIANAAGNTMPAFDSNDTVFYAMSDDSLDKLTETNGELRYEAHEAALQKFLNLLSSQCGLGNNYYSFENGTAKTATEVISEKSDLYSNLKKNELVLENALVNMVEAIADLNGVDANGLNVKISFDDSIITDTDAEANRAMLEVNARIIDAVEYYKRVYKMTEEAALKLHQEILNRAPVSTNPDNILYGDGQ